MRNEQYKTNNLVIREVPNSIRQQIQSCVSELQQMASELPSSENLTGLNFETDEVETISRKPEQITPVTSTFGISCALPSKLSSQKEMWVDKVGKCILGSTYHQEMVKKVSEIIKEIADIDDTVGKKIYSLIVQ